MNNMKKIFSLLLTLAILLTFTACNSKKDNSDENLNDNSQTAQTQEPTEAPENSDSELYADPIAFTIELENGGIMSGELYPNLAPKTVENFVNLANKNFYDGLIFHRVIEGFMIQGGGYDENMTPAEAEAIDGEFASNGFENNLKHTKGVISMARTQDPNSASSQFFIMHADAPHLDGEYAAFGRITEGLDIIDEIATAPTTIYQEYNMSDVPEKPIIIKTITINK